MNFSDLSKRLLASLGAVCLVILWFFCAHLPFLAVLFPASVAGIAALEWVELVKKKGVVLPKWLFAAIAFVCTASFALPFPFAVFYVLLLGLFIFFFSQIEGAIFRISSASFFLFYVALPLGLLSLLLFQWGWLWTAYLLAVSKGSDIGAYFGGRVFGKRLLCPVLSPKKTVEGFFIGLLTAVAISLGFSYVLPISIGFSVLLGAVLGVFAALGDLAESLLKRDAEVKNSGIIPGFGGVLDLLDSLLFNIVILYLWRGL